MIGKSSQRNATKARDLHPAPAVVEAPVYNVMLTSPQSAAAEAISALRTHVQSQHLHRGRRALALCSPSPESGCTFVAANLAVSLSQIGVKTLLIDANLREPEIHRYFGVTDPGGGLHAYLEGDCTISECTREGILDDLDVVFAGAPATRAQELLSSVRFANAINSCMRDYDITIIDTPPANRCADPLTVSAVVGFSLIAVRQNRSLVSDVRTLVDQLRREGVQIIGTVMSAY